MWRNDDTLIQKALPFLHRGRKRLFHLIADMPLLSIAADQNGQSDIRHSVQQRLTPGFGAALHRWNVAAILVISRKTESHRDNRNFGCVVERLFIHVQPVPQSNAGWIGERPTRLHREITWRLTRNQNSGRIGHLQYRFRRTLHVSFA